MNRLTRSPMVATPASVPAIPFPAQPDAPQPVVREVSPHNCVRREPLPGGQSIELVGYDGGGHPWVRVQLALDVGEEKINSWARLIGRESEHMPALLRERLPASALPSGPRLVKP